jgi:hypothetical protein
MDVPSLLLLCYGKIRQSSEKVLTFSEDAINLSHEPQIVNMAPEAPSTGENDIITGPQAGGQNHFIPNGAGILAG